MLPLLLSVALAADPPLAPSADLAAEFPRRLAPDKPLRVEWEPGRRDDVVHLKLAEGTLGEPTLQGAEIRPLFRRDPEQIRAQRRRIDPDERLADLTLWYRVEVGPGEGPAVADAFNDQPWVELAYLAPEAAPPPADIPPDTPDLSGEQHYLADAPEGFGFAEAALWPGGRGENVAIADLEYGWTREHEDLVDFADARTWGWDSGYYAYHGTAVLGLLFAGDNGYGMTGLVPDAEPVVVFPYVEPGSNGYDLAAAVDAAAELLESGDVLLIEQQVVEFGSYAPVEADPATWDAIANAVARGIVVVEPTGNGGIDLDDPIWEGWFDRDLRDSGAIMVGGGASPDSGLQARAWYPGGSAYGERVDVQGWYDSIATPFNGDYGASWADLFYPDSDPLQAYTSQFGGTSGASPLVTAVCAITQSVSIELRGEPLSPLELRALLVSTGTPQEGSRAIGPQPDLRRLLRTLGP